MASKADQTAKPITGGRSVVSIIGETYACPTHHHHHHQCCLHQSQIQYYHHHHHHHLYHWYSVPTAKIILLLSSSSPPWSMVVRKANYTKAGGHSYSPSNLPSLLLFHFLKQASKGRKELNTVLMLSVITTTTTIIINSTTTRENKRQRDANNTTLMLIVVISVFLAVELPLMVMSALHTINSR